MASLRTTTLALLRHDADRPHGVLTDASMAPGHRLREFHETFHLSPGDMRIGFHTK